MPLNRLDHRALATAFIEANSHIAELSALLQIPPPLIEHTAKGQRKGSRKVILGEHNFRQCTITLHLPANGTPHSLLETAYHEFGHYIDTVIFSRALGQTYWLPMICSHHCTTQQPLFTGNLTNDGAEDFADSIMLYFSLPLLPQITPDDVLARIGQARFAAIQAMFEYRSEYGDKSFFHYHMLLNYMREAVVDAK